MAFLRLSHRTGAFAILIALLVALLPAGTTYVSAAELDQLEKINLAPAEVRVLFWIVNALDLLEEKDSFETAAFALVLQHLYKGEPLLASSSAAAQIASLRQAYDSSLRSGLANVTYSEPENLLSVFSVLNGLSASTMSGSMQEAIAAAAGEVFELALGQPMTGISFGDDRITAALEMHHGELELLPAYDSIIQKSLSLGSTNSRFAAAFDKLWKGVFLVGLLEPLQALIDKSPILQRLPEILALLDSSGRLRATIGQLQNLVDAAFTVVNAVFADVQAFLAQLDVLQTNLIAYAGNAALRDQKMQAFNSASGSWNGAVRMGKAKLLLLGKAIGRSIQELARRLSSDIKRVAAAVVQIVKKLINYTRLAAMVGAVAQRIEGQLENILVSASQLIGGIAGAVMGIVAIFDEQRSKPDQMILDVIGALREDVASLRVEMGARFDRIDKQLNLIYDTINTRFDQIDLTLGQLTQSVAQIQASLSAIQKQMNRFEKNMYDLLSEGFQMPLWENINGGVGYRQRTGESMTYSKYENYENIFHSWATIHAFNSVYAGPSARVFDDDHVYDELNKYPLDTNVDYLNRWLETRWGLPKFATETLPNPRVWAISGRGYAEIQDDNPAYAYRIAAGRATEIMSDGQALQTALRKISTTTVSGQPQGNRVLFNTLVDNYGAKVSAFDTALQAAEASYLTGLRTSLGGRAGNIDLWGGANQTLAAADNPSFTNLSACQGGYAVSAPSNTVSIMFPQPFLVARYLNLGTLSVCYTADWVETSSQYFPRAGNTNYYGSLQVDVSSYYGSTLIRTRTVKQSQELYGQCSDSGECFFDDPYEETVRDWTTGTTTLKSRVESGGTVSYDDTTLAGTTATSVENSLKEKQQALYQTIIDGFATGPIELAARRLSGAKALLDGYITLGLGRALESDEYFRSFLYGSQRLLDEDAEQRLSARYASAKINPPASNVRAQIMATMNTRIDALEGVIGDYLDLIDTGEYQESQRLIQTTLDRLGSIGDMVWTPVARHTPSRVAFSRQTVGTRSGALKVTVINAGAGAPLRNIKISISGANATDFKQSTTCASTLAAGKSCTISVTFQPGATGARSATLRIVSNAPGSPQDVPLSGTGR